MKVDIAQLIIVLCALGLLGFLAVKNPDQALPAAVGAASTLLTAARGKLLYDHKGEDDNANK